MPVQWTISHSKRLVVAVAKGEMPPGAMVGPIAIVAHDDATFEQACQFADVAELVRPIRVFREWHEGRHWIDAVAIDRANAAE